MAELIKKGKETYLRKKNGDFRINIFSRQAVMTRYRKEVEELTQEELDEWANRKEEKIKLKPRLTDKEVIALKKMLKGK